jgi:hypothetical protein
VSAVPVSFLRPAPSAFETAATSTPSHGLSVGRDADAGGEDVGDDVGDGVGEDVDVELADASEVDDLSWVAQAASRTSSPLMIRAVRR